MNITSHTVGILALSLAMCVPAFSGIPKRTEINPNAKEFVSAGVVEFKDKQALIAATEIGAKHHRTVLKKIKDHDLLEFQCSGDSPMEAKKNADSLVRQLRKEETQRIDRENGKGGQVKAAAGPVNKYYIFHDLPDLPNKPADKKKIEQAVTPNGP